MSEGKGVQAEYQTVEEIKGPLMFLEETENVAYGDIVEIQTPEGEKRRGEVLETSKDTVIVQVYEETEGLGRNTSVKFLEEDVKMPVTEDLLGRILNGRGEPIDGGPEIVPEEERSIVGEAINPFSRELPEDFIQTGISAIDGMNTLVRGQKLPIFSGPGMPHNEIALQIARQAEVVDQDEDFAVVFAGMGITNEEAQEFMRDFRETGALERSVVFLNIADDPAAERIVTPRMALTTAEYLAFEKDMHVLVILTDMTNYCNSLREIAAAREEVPGRRGYPGYMYTDLAQIYERAGQIEGEEGSITQVPILTMVGDDITHPIPDLTGYITEGQIVLDRDLHNRGIYPPIDVLESLSRLMDQGIGDDKTRGDHSELKDQLFADYAEGVSLRELVQIVGEDALSESDQKVLNFAEEYEEQFVQQGQHKNRTIGDTLQLSWDLLGMLPKESLNRIDPETLDEYYEAMEPEEEGG
ncbi:MAG: V-type ATP synthase subunit B [Candidatus Nanohaloarchaeota archaeon QJJ-7]|nr:V-type ATP synthase subunit B [Candidatus Nanohaloarchaeota archaeon QJJ-7]